MQLRPVNELRWPPPPRRRTGRRVLFVLAALLVLAAVGYTVWWFVATGALRERALAWIESRRGDGWQVTYENVARAGFPHELAVRFTAPAATSPDQRVRWRGESAHLATAATGGTTLRLRLDGEQALGLGSGQDRQEWTGRAERAQFDLRPPPGWMPEGQLQVLALHATRTGTGDLLEVERLDLNMQGDPAASSGPDDAGWSMRLDIAGLRLPAAVTLPFGPEIASLQLDAALYGPLRPQPWPEALADWRDAGGVLEATRLAAVSGPLSLEGEGTVALDKQGQPIGALTTRIRGHEQALDRLAEARTIPVHTAAAAKILLRAMARAGIDGDSPTLVAPLSLQGRTLFVGPVPLLQVPELSWIAAPNPRRGR